MSGKKEKFRTHAGPKTVDEVMSEVMGKPRKPGVLAAEAVLPGEFPGDVLRVGPSDYGVKDAESVVAWNREVNGFFDDVTHAVSNAGATGPVGSIPQGAPVGANGPAGPVGPHRYPGPTGATGPAGSMGAWVRPADFESAPRDRAEVDLRKAIRRCHKEGVPPETMIEIFRLELVDVVHDD
jgi:hypothetical protein